VDGRGACLCGWHAVDKVVDWPRHDHTRQVVGVHRFPARFSMSAFVRIAKPVFGGTSVMKSNLNCANAVSRPSLGASARDSDRRCVTQSPATRDSSSTVRQTGHVDAALLAAHESNQRPRHREWNLFRWVD